MKEGRRPNNIDGVIDRFESFSCLGTRYVSCNESRIQSRFVEEKLVPQIEKLLRVRVKFGAIKGANISACRGIVRLSSDLYRCRTTAWRILHHARVDVCLAQSSTHDQGELFDFDCLRDEPISRDSSGALEVEDLGTAIARYTHRDRLAMHGHAELD